MQENFDAQVKETLNRAFQYYWTVVHKLGHKWTNTDTKLGEKVKEIVERKRTK